LVDIGTEIKGKEIPKIKIPNSKHSDEIPKLKF
jgi:hypothetical protein